MTDPSSNVKSKPPTWATITPAGIAVEASYGPNWYPTGGKVGDIDVAAVAVRPTSCAGMGNDGIRAA